MINFGVENSRKIKYKVFFFLITYTIAILTKNPFILFLAIILLILNDKRFILPYLFTTPLVETILVAIAGVTITKLLVIYLVVYFIFDLLVSNKNISMDYKSFSLILYFGVVIYGMFNSMYIIKNPLAYWSPSSVFVETIYKYFPMIIFAFLVYQFLINQKQKFIFDSLYISIYSISFYLIIVVIYFITIGNTTSNWWNVATRLSFTGADPNEFSGLISALSVFPLYLIFYSNKKSFLLGFISFLLSSYAILQTLSRGGILTLLFTFSIFLLIYFKDNFKKISTIVIFILIFILIIINMGFININPLIERFTGQHVENVSDLTTGRFDLWLIALREISTKPILGFGGSGSTPLWLTGKYIGSNKVLHNLYLEVLLRYGIIGFFSFLFILFIIIKDLLNLRRYISVIPNLKLLLLPFISLATLLFAGMGLTWLWREIIWFLIGINYSLIYFVIRKE
jgi:O-antigen ligase